MKKAVFGLSVLMPAACLLLGCASQQSNLAKKQPHPVPVAQTAKKSALPKDFMAVSLYSPGKVPKKLTLLLAKLLFQGTTLSASNAKKRLFMTVCALWRPAWEAMPSLKSATLENTCREPSLPIPTSRKVISRYR